MDPAEKASKELNAIFARLEVPCEVCVTSEAGKHMKATADLAEGFALVEELPIVSWPTASLLNLHVPFCFHCLRLSTRQLRPHLENSNNNSNNHAKSSSASATLPSFSAPPLPEKWTHCAHCNSCFCSVDCQQASARVHRLLCSSLTELRAGRTQSGTAAAGTSSPSSLSSAAGAAVANVVSGISVEALARCVAWIAQRLSLVIGQQRLTHDLLQADYSAQHPQSTSGSGTGAAASATTAWSQDSINYQLFSQVVAPFSRLISPPDSVQFDGVSLPAWLRVVRSALAEKCVKLLLVASGAPLGTLRLHPLRFDTDELTSGVSEAADGAAEGHASAGPLYWAEALVQILFSTDTLRTLVGQMVLNAHGVNDFVLPAAGSSASAPSSAPSSAPTSASPAVKGKFEWILKGAGLYALLSSFNHSCEPNAAVSNVNDTHEIVLKTTRAVKAGEEITITYIPLTESTTLAERQQLLKNYFFTCRCPRCVREGKSA